MLKITTIYLGIRAVKSALWTLASMLEDWENKTEGCARIMNDIHDMTELVNRIESRLDEVVAKP